MNAIYSVSEEDLANKAGQYTIKMTGVKVTKGADENFGSELTVYVGAYSLTTGGLKTYITTKVPLISFPWPRLQEIHGQRLLIC